MPVHITTASHLCVAIQNVAVTRPVKLVRGQNVREIQDSKQLFAIDHKWKQFTLVTLASKCQY